MHLLGHHNATGIQCKGNIAIVFRPGERELSCGEQVWRDGAKRTAAQRRAPGLGGPLEVVGNVRKAHVGCDRPLMDIIGTGLDATEISRIAEAIERYGDHFVRRVFTEGEIAYCRAKRSFAASFAARFAAKEAAMKALGTGYSRGVYWTTIEVVRHHGPPTLQFHAGAAARFARMGGTRSIVTLTHSRDLAIAHVMLLGS